MASMDERKLLLRFLLKRLRETKTELYAFRSALANFSPEDREGVYQLQRFYREASEIQAIAEKEFQPFYELIEQHPEESQTLVALLEKWSPTGEPN